MSIQVTLQDIADRAGVSRTTVSLALRNHPGLPGTTRQRIQRIAEELGYRPNPLVSSLMSYQRAARSDRPKHLVLAMVLRFSRRGAWREYLPPDLISGARNRAERLGYQLEEFWLEDLGMDGRRLTQVLCQRSVPGILVAPMPIGASQLQIDWDAFSVLGIGYSEVSPQFHRVTSDHYEAMFLALARLRREGYQRFGLALEVSQDDRVHHQWMAAFAWDQMQGSPADHVPPLLLERNQWSERRFAAWFRMHRPEVVLGCDPQMIDWLDHLGCDVPRDVGFGHLWTPDLSGEFAGLYHDPPAIGALAVDVLVTLIQRNERGLPRSPTTLQLEASWVDGKTLRPRPARRRVAAWEMTEEEVQEVQAPELPGETVRCSYPRLSGSERACVARRV